MTMATKLRIVFDASVKGDGPPLMNTSTRDCLLVPLLMEIVMLHLSYFDQRPVTT